ncbi:MAG: YciI family protein [Chloroflexota bacterium]
MLMFTRGEWQETASEEEQRKIFATVGEWWEKLARQGTIVEGNRLEPPHTATTVVLNRGQSTLFDGPFMESKEAIGGYGIVDVANLDAAIAVARSFPSPNGKVEVRPVAPRQR